MIARNIAVVLSGRDAGLARTLGAATGAIRGFEVAVEGANRRSSRLAGGLKAGLAAMAVALAVGLGAAVGAAVKFDTAMRNVNTVAHESESGLKAMSAAVLDLSTELPQSATQLADGLRDIAGSGFYGADALQILEVSAKAASAGMTDTHTSSKAVVAVLNAYGMSAEHAADVSDVLFSTVEYGVLTFEDLANQMGDVVAGAAMAGISIDEVGAAIATMTLSGLNAGEATVSLNRLIRELVDPGKALAATFTNLGYESGVAALEQKGLHGVMEEIRVVTGGSVLALQQLFPEIRAGRAAFALMAASGTTYARVQALITDETGRAGATQRAFNEQMKALGNQWDLFKNKITAVGIELGTALIPALSSALSWVEKMGPVVGRQLTSAWNAAQPAIRATGDAIMSVVDVLRTLWQVAGPTLKLIAGVSFAAAIGAFTALGQTISFVADFLAEHPALVGAIAAAYGAVLAGRLLMAASAFLQLQAGLMAVRVGLAGLAAQTVLTTLISRLQILGTVIGTAFSTGQIGSLRNATTAFSGLGTALKSIGPQIIGAVVIGGFVALADAMKDASDRANELRESTLAPYDMTTLQGLRGGIEALDRQLVQLDEDWANATGTGNGFVEALTGAGQMLTPFENTLQDNKQATNELRDAQEAAAATAAMWEHDLATLSNALGLTAGEVQVFLDQLDYDPSSTSQTTEQLEAQIRNLMLAAQNATPAAAALESAIDTMGNPASTAADRIDALNATMEELIGTALAASDSAIAFEQAIDDMAETALESGTSLDIGTQEGRDWASAINEAASAALEHANAVAEESGSVAEGAEVLATHRQALLDQMVALGMTTEEANAYLDTIGLTPENVQTVINLAGHERAMFDAEQYQALLGAIDQAVATGTVELDTSTFDNDAVKIGITLAQIGMANPEATVSMDGAPFRATAEQVDIWAATWDDASPEAQALLNIIDPTNKYPTLSAAAAGWGSTTTTATANLNDAPANGVFARVTARLFKWGSSTGTANANANPSQAHSAIGGAQSRLNLWDLMTGTSNVNANDNASGVIGRVQLGLSNIDGTVATATVQITQRIISSLFSAEGGIVPDFFYGGGVVYAQTGMVANTNGHPGGPKGTDTVPAWLTPGEMILNRKQQTQLWNMLSMPNYGLAVYDQGAQTSGSGGKTITVGPIVTHVTVAADVDKTAVRREVSAAMQDTLNSFTSSIRREIRTA